MTAILDTLYVDVYVCIRSVRASAIPSQAAVTARRHHLRPLKRPGDVTSSGLPDNVPFTWYTGPRHANSKGHDILLLPIQVVRLRLIPTGLQRVYHALAFALSSHAAWRKEVLRHQLLPSGCSIGSAQPERQQRTPFLGFF
eukprot:5742471-Prymnesium_polylepis.1